MKVGVLSPVLFLGVLPLAGQARLGLKADIPFAFEVSNRVLPAGEYRMWFLQEAAAPVVCLRQVGGPYKAIAHAMELWIAPGAGQASAVLFNRYGDRHFLAGAGTPGRKFGVFKSRNEKALVTSRMVAQGFGEEVRVIAQVR